MDEPTVKVVKHSFPLVTVAIYGDKNREYLLDVANKLKSSIVTLEDLSDVLVRGDSDKELIISFDEQKIDAFGLDKLQIVNAVKQLSTIFPVGIIKDLGTHYYLSTFNGEKELDKIQNTIIKINEKRVYLKDIANIKYALADANSLSHFNGKPNISISINKSEEGDSIELVKQIKQILKTYENKYRD